MHFRQFIPFLTVNSDFYHHHKDEGKLLTIVEVSRTGGLRRVNHTSYFPVLKVKPNLGLAAAVGTNRMGFCLSLLPGHDSGCDILRRFSR
jgi:hypothetical protein